MQPIMNEPHEDDTPDRQRPAPARTPAESSDFYPMTVFLWILSVATVCVIVGLICTEFFADYFSLLGNLTKE